MKLNKCVRYLYLVSLLLGLGNISAAVAANAAWLAQQDKSDLMLQLSVSTGVKGIPSEAQLRSLNAHYPAQRVVYFKNKTAQGKSVHYFYLAAFSNMSTAKSAKTQAGKLWSNAKLVRLGDVAKKIQGKPRVYNLSGKKAPEPRAVRQTATKPKPIKKVAPPSKTVSRAWFVKAGAGVASLSDRGTTAALQQRGHSAQVESDTNVLAYQLAAGYRLSSRFALQLGLTSTADVDSTLTFPVSANINTLAQDYQELSPYGFSSYTLSARYLWPLSAAWSLGGELGLAQWSAEKEAIKQSDGTQLAAPKDLSGSGSVVAVAAEYRLAEQLLIGVDVQQLLLDENATLFSVSAVYEW